MRLFVGAAELLMRQSGIVALHAVTSTNALHFAYGTTANDETRRLLLLQNAAFLPLFRQAMTEAEQNEDRLDQLEPIKIDADSPTAIEEIFAAVSDDRGCRWKNAGYLEAGGDPQRLIDAARLLIFLKGDNAHDYKFSTAVLEDYYHVSPGLAQSLSGRQRVQAAWLDKPDNRLVDRTRAALRA